MVVALVRDGCGMTGVQSVNEWWDITNRAGFTQAQILGQVPT